MDEVKVGSSVKAFRRRKTEKHQPSSFDRLSVGGMERDQVSFGGSGDEFGETVLKDGYLAGAKTFDPALVCFPHADPMTQVGQTCRGDQTNVPCSDYGDFHCPPSSLASARLLRR